MGNKYSVTRAAAIRWRLAEIEEEQRIEWDDDLACEAADLRDELKELESDR